MTLLDHAFSVAFMVFVGTQLLNVIAAWSYGRRAKQFVTEYGHYQICCTEFEKIHPDYVRFGMTM